ncbi:carbohydrate kinase family protein [Candidatus Solirubrobacter pratensis]|uniref:carbohydrate kinase family protein n=1 Tax=Candidatus Solirubrobacter pratensis TaxID=1298857 RepID=UPI0004083713|nr:sugar kinase [Candidatus Solirubrobacter pratensis]
MTRVVVVGDLMADVVTAHDGPIATGSDTPARITLRPGGSAANVAAWLARVGADVTLIGRVGTDAAADVALGGLRGVDLRIARDADRPTGTCVVLVAPGGERTMLPDPGANDALSPNDLPDDAFTGGILHVSGYALLRHGPRAAALTAIDRAREAGMKVSVDPASAAPLANDPIFLDRITPIDLLLPNEDEAAVLGRQLKVPEVVITRGGRGATWTNGFESVDARAVPAEVVDTTGAGDAFAAGFLSAWPGPPEQALAAGAKLAAEAVQQPGGRPLYD